MNRLTFLNYRFQHWLFRWISDEDGDIGLSLAGGLFTLIKHKEHTLVKVGKSYASAGKWQGHADN